MPTEALIKAWSRKKLLLACKPRDKSVQQRRGNIRRLKNLMEVKHLYMLVWFQRESGSLSLQQPVSDLLRRKEAGSQTGPKEGRQIFHILRKLY